MKRKKTLEKDKETKEAPIMLITINIRAIIYVKASALLDHLQEGFTMKSMTMQTMQKTSSYVIIVLTFLVIVLFASASPAEAASPLQDEIDAKTQDWNKNPVWSYRDAWQCNAFTRYMFSNIYQHRDGTQCEQCHIQRFYGPDSTELKHDLVNYAQSGDVVRVTAQSDPSKTHTFMIYQVDPDTVTIVESNVIGKSVNNSAIKRTLTYKKLLENIIGSDSSYTGYVLHSKNQPYSSTEANISIERTRKAYSPNRIGVRVDGRVHSNYTTIVETGVQISLDGGQSFSYASIDYNLSITDKYVNMWYVLPRDLGIQLKSGYTYTFRFYAIDGYGNIWYSDNDTFTLR